MIWMTVTIEPDDGNGAGCAALPRYILCVPVLPDGRLDFRFEPEAPEGPRMWRYAPDGESRPGHLRLIDHHWTCYWDGVGGPADLRLMSPSFGPDDRIGVRAGNEPLAIYRVSERTALQLRPDDCR